MVQPQFTRKCCLCKADIYRAKRLGMLKDMPSKRDENLDNQTITKQENAIKTLEMQKHNLSDDVNICTSAAQENQNKEACCVVEHLMNQNKELTSEVETRKAELKQIDSTISRVLRLNNSLRKVVIDDVRALKSSCEFQRKITSLNNRLHVMTMKYDSTVARARTLQQELSGEVNMRAKFIKEYQKIIETLVANQSSTEMALKHASLSFSGRESWLEKLSTLKARNKLDLDAQCYEMQVLSQQLMHLWKLQSFMGTKGQRRCMKDREEREAREKAQERVLTQRTVDDYRHIVDKLKQFTGANDTERMRQKYSRTEYDNMALFTYVNELNKEVNILSDTVDTVRTKLDELTFHKKEIVARHKAVVESLRNKVMIEAQDREQVEKAVNANNEKLETLLKGIESAFKLIGGDNFLLLEKLGENQHVTKFNARWYLKNMEKRCSNLMQQAYYYERLGEPEQTTFVEEEEVEEQDDDMSGQKEWQPLELPRHHTVTLKKRLKKAHVIDMGKAVPELPCLPCAEQEEFMREEEAPYPQSMCEINHRLDIKESKELKKNLHSMSACRLANRRNVRNTLAFDRRQQQQQGQHDTDTD